MKNTDDQYIFLDDFYDIEQFSIILLNKELKIKFVNKGTSRLFGYPPAELKGKKLTDVFNISGQEDFYSFTGEEKNLKKYGGWHFETTRQTAGGQIRHIFVAIIPVHLDNQLYLLEIAYDISPRVKIERSLRNALISFTKLNELNELLYSTHSSGEILYIFMSFLMLKEGLDIEYISLIMHTGSNQLAHYRLSRRKIGEHLNSSKKDAQSNYVFKNKLLHFFPAIRKKIKNMTPELLPVNPEHWKSFIDNRMQKARKKGMNIFELNRKDYQELGISLKDKDYGTEGICIPLSVLDEPPLIIVLHFSGDKFRNKNEFMAILQLFATHFYLAYMNGVLYELLQDRIRELKAAYRQLEESQNKLIRFERLAAIGELTAQIAHEIRNPLVSIGGFARLIKKKSTDGSEIQKYSEIIVSEVERLEGILNNMLDYIRTDRLNLKRLNFNKLIFHTIELFKADLDENFSLQFIPDTNCPLIEVDEEKIHQVVINLLQNAIQAMPSGGTITLKTQCENGRLSFYIIDEGSGIPKHIMKKLFDPFITTKPNGTGLGLAITKKILDMHGAEITIKNMKPKGTMIHISFRISPKK